MSPFEEKAPAELASAEPGFCTKRVPSIPGLPFFRRQRPDSPGTWPLAAEEGEMSPVVASVVQKPPFHRDELGGAPRSGAEEAAHSVGRGSVAYL